MDDTNDITDFYDTSLSVKIVDVHPLTCNVNAVYGVIMDMMIKQSSFNSFITITAIYKKILKNQKIIVLFLLCFAFILDAIC